MENKEIQKILESRHENLSQELKDWLNLEDESGLCTLMKEICALTNHGGGIILIGFNDTPPHNSNSCPENIDISKYNQDFINGKIKKHLEPSFHIDLYEGLIGENRHFIIKVPSEFNTPVRINDKGLDNVWSKNSYFIRKQGPKSEPPLTGKEWDDFIQSKILARKTDLVSSIERLIKGAEIQTIEEPILDNWIDSCLENWKNKVKDLPAESPSKFEKGFFWFAFELKDSRELKTPELLNLIKERKKYTGWPMFLDLSGYDCNKKPYAVNDGIEAWLGINSNDNPNYNDFWKVSKNGKFFIIRGLMEDSNDAPDQIFSALLPINQITDCLLFIVEMAKKLDIETINFKCNWTGLKDRKLKVWPFNHRHDFAFDEISKENYYKSEIYSFSLNDLEINLKQIVFKILTPLINLFDFTELSQKIFDESIDELIKNGR